MPPRVKQAVVLWGYCLMLIPILPFFAFYASIRVLRGNASVTFGPDWTFNYHANQPRE